MEEIRFAHVSDTHIVAAGSSAFLHRVQREVRDPLENMKEGLAALSCQNLDFLLLTGDLIHEGEAEDYQNYRALVNRYLPGLPLCCALGNHDRRAAFRQGFLGQQTMDEGPYLAAAQIKGLQIISLDSPYADGMRGSLPADQLNYLARRLENQPPRGSIVLMHNPAVGQQTWGPMAAPEEYRHILRQGEVKAVFAGHLHSAYSGCGGGPGPASAASKTNRRISDAGKGAYRMFSICLPDRGSHRGESQVPKDLAFCILCDNRIFLLPFRNCVLTEIE